MDKVLLVSKNLKRLVSTNTQSPSTLARPLKIQSFLSQDLKLTCQRYLNACSPEQPEGPIDQKFQSLIIECTADDQKKIRRRLAHLLSLIERSEKTVAQQFSGN
ncbi:unnamed protein product [Soboliphyme baturini]|uniref:BAG domain-containing protein n=1 Tax=Soboliphyme baturini TaxID=241478 RepID=A0A3P8BI94_9BILA|nr:unnamed protein product [Soboliphyme baturini]